MNTPKVIAAFGMAILVILTSCDRPVAPTESVSESASPQAQVTNRTEQQWIVDSIIRDIADLAVYARDPKAGPLSAEALNIESVPADAHGYHYNVSIRLPGEPKPVQLPLDISGAIWDPVAYQPVAHALLEALQLTGTTDSTMIEQSPVSSLIYPLTENIQRQNERVSALLTSHPLAPEAHEQAAFIIGTLGLRENSGEFWDTRGVCNRATAHLALARAIRGNQPMSDSGEVGELLIGLLDDTKKDCEQRITKLKDRAQAKPELYPWIVAAQLRNRRDWRILDHQSAATLLERIEYFRARCESVSPETASRQLLEESPENVADWYCIILQFNFSVGAGHVFTQAGLNREFKEIGQIFPGILVKKLTPETLAEALNKPPGGAVQQNASGRARIVVIDDGMWAHYFQRHLCHIACRTHYFLQKKWGVPDNAADFKTKIGALFAKLTFVPLLQVLWTNSPGLSDREFIAPAVELVTKHSEWVSAIPWAMIPRNGSIRVPSMSKWFSPGLPAGTAYCYYGRDDHVFSVKKMTAADLKKLFYDVAPWHYGVAFNYMRAMYGEKPTPEQFRSVLAPFLDFNVNAMRWYAYYAKDDFKECVATYQRIAKLDPDCYLTLGDYYRDHQMAKEAAEAIEAAIANHADPVAVTYSTGWLANYYFDHDRKDRALAIATDAAEVYSRVGLETMAELQERMGNSNEAESYFKKIKERYDKDLELIAFYQRQATLHPDSSYVDKLKSNIGSIFPGGVKSVTLADFSEPPKKGVIIAGHNDLLLKCGLKEGTIIVALDGKRVDSFPQYQFVRALTKSPHMEFVVFQDHKYQFVKTEVPNRMFDLQFNSWP